MPGTAIAQTDRQTDRQNLPFLNNLRFRGRVALAAAVAVDIFLVVPRGKVEGVKYAKERLAGRRIMEVPFHYPS